MKTWTIFNLKKFFFKLKLWLFFSRRKETYVHLEETYVHLCKFPYSVKIFFFIRYSDTCNGGLFDHRFRTCLLKDTLETNTKTLIRTHYFPFLYWCHQWNFLPQVQFNVLYSLASHSYMFILPNLIWLNWKCLVEGYFFFLKKQRVVKKRKDIQISALLIHKICN